MTILDTSIIIKLVKKKEVIDDDITIVTLAEFPQILEYKRFHGNVIYPTKADLDLTVELQQRLIRLGKPKSFPDLLIAAICISREEESS